MILSLSLYNLRSANNVGAILRSAAFFGVSEVIATGYTPYPVLPNDTRLPHESTKITRAITKTSLGSESLLKISRAASLKTLIEGRRGAGWKIVALEQSGRSQPLKSYKPDSPTLIVVGNEVEGLSDEDLSLADVVLEIGGAGPKESLNVATATGIALYEITKENKR